MGRRSRSTRHWRRELIAIRLRRTIATTGSSRRRLTISGLRLIERLNRGIALSHESTFLCATSVSLCLCGVFYSGIQQPPRHRGCTERPRNKDSYCKAIEGEERNRSYRNL